MTAHPTFGADGPPGQSARPGELAPVSLPVPPAPSRACQRDDGAGPQTLVREVPLAGIKGAGRVALVDETDFELVSAYRWYVWENVLACGTLSGPYAIAQVPTPGRKSRSTSLRMHKLITGWPLTDHINHDGLDNRRCNLRPASPSQNQMNQQRQRPVGTSTYRGVRWHRRCRAWQAAITKHYKERHLGLYQDEVQAALAYDRAAAEMFGEYAVLNFPGGANASR